MFAFVPNPFVPVGGLLGLVEPLYLTLIYDVISLCSASLGNWPIMKVLNSIQLCARVHKHIHLLPAVHFLLQPSAIEQGPALGKLCLSSSVLMTVIHKEQ